MLSPDFLFYFVSVSLLGSGYLFDCLKLPWLFPPVPHYLIYIYGLWFSLSCSNLLSPLFEWLDLYCMPCSICLIFVFNLIFCTVFLSESRFFFFLYFFLILLIRELADLNFVQLWHLLHGKKLWPKTYPQIFLVHLSVSYNYYMAGSSCCLHARWEPNK